MNAVTAATAQTPVRLPQHKNMRWIPGGTFWMGSEEFYPEEKPVHQVSLDGFWMDEHPVTVAEFRRFVKATGYRTTAEVAPAADDYPGADPSLLVPGSLVFRPSAGPVPLDDYRQWWTWAPGADWRHPEGPSSGVGGRELHPVTHVSYADAATYATWAGKQLPTEAQWELAARGGLDRKRFVWGDEFTPHGRYQANTWQGQFPWQNLAEDGFVGTSPVGKFPANGYGLYDMAGNVWEWTQDRFTGDHTSTGKNTAPASSCCIPHNPRYDTTAEPSEERYPPHVIKGGSHLCAPNYCLRYRPAARSSETEESSTSHLGFRCISR